jgi:hypothetical protein
MEIYLLVEKKPEGAIERGELHEEYSITRVFRSYETESRADEDFRLLSEFVALKPGHFIEVINVLHLD